MFETLDAKEWLTYNAKLQAKKNALRKALNTKGVLKKEGNNTYDKYKYFTEAQYKMLFTELFSEYKLELKFDEVEYNTFEGSEKQANGRMPRIVFSLIDVETGFYENTTITGEGIDKGDKAGYKAYTGALKYYLADTFMVATGDDPETESPENKMNQVKREARQLKPDYNPDAKVDPMTLKFIVNAMPADRLKTALDFYGVKLPAELTKAQAGQILNKLKKEGASA